MLGAGTWDFGRGSHPEEQGPVLGAGDDGAAMQPEPSQEPRGLLRAGRAGDARGAGKVCAADALRVCRYLD